MWWVRSCGCVYDRAIEGSRGEAWNDGLEGTDQHRIATHDGRGARPVHGLAGLDRPAPVPLRDVVAISRRRLVVHRDRAGIDGAGAGVLACRVVSRDLALCQRP